MKTKIFMITIFLVISVLSVSFFFTHALASNDSRIIVVSEEEESISESEYEYENPIQDENEEYKNNEENENLYNKDDYKWRDEEVEVFEQDQNSQRGLLDGEPEEEEK